MRAQRTYPQLVIAVALTLVLGMFVGGCGSNKIDPAFVASAGEHGNVLQANNVFLTDESLTKLDKDEPLLLDWLSSPAGVTAFELQRTRDDTAESQARLKRVRRRIEVASEKLRKLPLPAFERHLEPTAAVKDFSANYKATTEVTLRTGEKSIAALDRTISAYDELLEFAAGWQKYLEKGDARALLKAVRSGTRRLRNLWPRRRAEIREYEFNSQLQVLAEKMAKDARRDPELAKLTGELAAKYQFSYLPKHGVK